MLYQPTGYCFRAKVLSAKEDFIFSSLGKFKKSCTSIRRKKECAQTERERRGNERRKQRGAERIARRDYGGGVESTSVKHGTRLTRGSKSCRGRGTRHKSVHRFLLFYFRARENFCLLVAVTSGGKMEASFATHGRLEERCARAGEKERKLWVQRTRQEVFLAFFSRDLFSYRIYLQDCVCSFSFRGKIDYGQIESRKKIAGRLLASAKIGSALPLLISRTTLRKRELACLINGANGSIDILCILLGNAIYNTYIVLYKTACCDLKRGFRTSCFIKHSYKTCSM